MGLLLNIHDGKFNFGNCMIGIMYCNALCYIDTKTK